MSDLTAFGGEDPELERLRMCLAEAGYPNAVVLRLLDGTAGIRAFDLERPEAAVPPEVAYRAFVICGHEMSRCLECWVAMTHCDHHP